jgi:hypothetical protein
MPSSGGLTIFVGHVPKSTTSLVKNPPFSGKIDFTEFISKACAESSTKFRVDRYVRLEVNRPFIVAVEVTSTFYWGSANALRLSLNFDGEDMLDDADVFITRPNTVPTTSNKNVKVLDASNRVIIDSFPLPAQNQPGLEKQAHLVVSAISKAGHKGSRSDLLDENPQTINNGTFGCLTLKMQKVSLFTQSAARKPRSRTSCASFHDDPATFARSS